MSFFHELRRRNALLFWFGLFNFAVTFICLFLTFEETQILGVNNFIIFSLAGGMMVGWLKHTVGAPDGGPLSMATSVLQIL